MRERYERSLMWKADEELEEPGSKLWTKIDAIINKSNIRKSEAKTDAKDSRRERKLTDMDMEGRFFFKCFCLSSTQSLLQINTTRE